MRFLLPLIAAASLCATAASADVVYSNDFSSNDSGFTGTSQLTTSPSGNQFLYFGGGGGSGSLSLSGLVANSAVSLAFDLYGVGSLDGYSPTGASIPGNGSGDYFTVSGAASFNQAFCNYGGSEVQSYPSASSACGAGAYSTNALGYSGFPETSGGFQDAEYAINLNGTADANGDVTFTFTDNSNEGTSNEFYGIDNVVVGGALASRGSAPVPEPFTLSLFGAGLAGAAALRRRKKTLKA